MSTGPVYPYWNRTGDLQLCGMMVNLVSHTGQGFTGTVVFPYLNSLVPLHVGWILLSISKKGALFGELRKSACLPYT